MKTVIIDGVEYAPVKKKLTFADLKQGDIFRMTESKDTLIFMKTNKISTILTDCVIIKGNSLDGQIRGRQSYIITSWSEVEIVPDKDAL